MSCPPLRSIGLLVSLGALIALSSCSRREAAPAFSEAQEEQVADTPSPLLEKASPHPTFKAALKEAHAAADQAGDRKSQERAALLLEQALLIPAPEGSPSALILQQDLSARASSLRLQLGEAEKARTLAEEGLSLSPIASAARAQLFIALADAEEALGQDAAAKRALLSALSLNQELFQREIEEP